MRVLVFVPVGDARIRVGGRAPEVVYGSAIVGFPPEPGQERLTVYVEGNLYGAANLERFYHRVEIAAGRMLHGYPTVARADVAVSDVAPVAVYDPDARTITLGPGRAGELLAWWLDVRLDALILELVP